MPDLSLVFDLLARDQASQAFDSVGKSAADAGKESEGFGSKLEGVWDIAKEAALPAGLAVGAAFFGAIEQNTANTKLTAELGLNAADSAAAGKLAGSLYSQNYGDSLDGVNEAIAAVSRNIGTNINSADMAGITSKVLDLSSAFGVDLEGSTNAVAQLMRTGLAKNAQEALDIITTGEQNGNDKAGDWLDTLNEYSVQFQKLGISGPEATGLISQGLKAGARDSDLVADAIKEFSIRAVDGSTTTAQGFASIGLNAGKMAADIGAGGSRANAALTLTMQHLDGIQDPVKRAQAATALFGTQAEDLGSALFALNPATAGLTNVTGAADKMDKTLSGGLGPTLETWKRTATQTAVDGAGALIAGFTQGSTSAGGWQGTVQNLAATVGGVLTPALGGLGDFLTGVVAPALGAVFGFLGQHQTTVLIIAGVIAAVMVPALIAWAAQSAIAGATSAGVWVKEALQSSWAAVQQGASIAAMVAGWIWHAGVAVAQGAISAAVWTGRIVASAAAGAVSFAVSIAQVVGGWILQGATAVAQGAVIAGVWAAQVVASAARGAISLGITVLEVVGGWLLMAGTAIVQAAIMAAAWFVALGPVGWVIAAVIGLVALIVANWDTVKRWTVEAWQAVTAAISAAWEWIKGVISAALKMIVWWFENLTLVGIIISHWEQIKHAFSAGIEAVVGFVSGLTAKIGAALASMGSVIAGIATAAWEWFYNNVVKKIGEVILFVGGLPGKILSALGNMGSVLLSAGEDLINGLISGIKNVAGKIGDAILGPIRGAVSGVKSLLGLASPSRVFAEIGANVGQGMVNGLAAMQPAVAAEMARLADTQSLDALTATLSGGAGGLGYSAPTYAAGPAAGGTAGGNTYVTTVSGVASPEQVAAVVERAQRTNEFLTGAAR